MNKSFGGNGRTLAFHRYRQSGHYIYLFDSKIDRYFGES
jgi:hypothetical protein